MKTANRNITLTFIFTLKILIVSAACELYNIDFINNQLSGPTYSATCAYNVTPAQWEVRNDTCSVTTSTVIVPGTGMVAVPISVRINRSGNLDCDDWVKLEYSINGVWYTQDSIRACDLSSAVQNYNFNVVCGALSALEVRVTYGDNGGVVEKWFLKDGDICISTPLTTLPIELIDFTAESENGKVKLNWATASEQDNDFFTIERSEDGISFDILEIVDGAGNSSQKISYYAIDESPTYGTTYYRLKQTDFDGKYEFSKTVSAKNNLDISDAFKVFPNPCEGGNFKLTINGCKDKEVLVVLFDAMGNQVYSKVVLEKNEIFYTAIDPKNKLNPGIYMVVASSQEKVFFNHRLIVR